MHTHLCSGSMTLCSKDNTKRAQRRTRGPSRHSSVLTGWTTYVHTYVHVPWTNCFYAVCVQCVCSNAYLCSGSRIPCTHWDSHSEHWKMNDGRFLHSDRRDCSLQYETDIHLCTIRLFYSIFRVGTNFYCEEAS